MCRGHSTVDSVCDLRMCRGHSTVDRVCDSVCDSVCVEATPQLIAYVTYGCVEATPQLIEYVIAYVIAYV